MPSVLAYAGVGEDTTCNPNPVMEVNWRQACSLFCKATHRLHISTQMFDSASQKISRHQQPNWQSILLLPECEVCAPELSNACELGMWQPDERLHAHSSKQDHAACVCSARSSESLARALTAPQVIPGHVHPYVYTVEEATPQNIAFIRLQGKACQPYLTVRCVQQVVCRHQHRAHSRPWPAEVNEATTGTRL